MSLLNALPNSRLEMPLSAKLLQQQPVTGSAAPKDFVGLLQAGVGEVNSLQNQAETSVHELLTGGDVDQAEVMTSVQKADMAFRMLLQIRNKLMQAYEEINSIRI
jgi:flagellar hook-basal body complex protein FliE